MNHLDKIKKLLRLSKSSNPHEAELALQRAMELATRHAVDLEQLANDPEFSDIAHRWFKAPARLPREWKSALGIVREYFHVTPCIDRSRRQVVLIGRGGAIEVADYVLHFLVRECRRQLVLFNDSERSRSRRMTSGKRAGFKAGFFIGIHRELGSTLANMIAATESLALALVSQADKRKEYMAGLMGKTVTTKLRKERVNSNAVNAGYAAGRATRINKPIGAQSENTLALV